MADHRRVPMSPERYDDQWRTLAAAGHNVHGEADLVEALLRGRADAGRLPVRPRVLDAGCGTGRVAIELDARGFDAVGVDVDERLLETARAKAPHLPWVAADLSTLTRDALPTVGGDGFDAIVLAGNVMIFVGRGTEATVVEQLAALLAPGGLLIAGFQLAPGRISLDEYERFVRGAGLTPMERWSTWDRAPFDPSAGYVVAVAASNR
jgi:SAM-dependent methyltransferase